MHSEYVLIFQDLALLRFADRDHVRLFGFQCELDNALPNSVMLYLVDCALTIHQQVLDDHLTIFTLTVAETALFLRIDRQALADARLLAIAAQWHPMLIGILVRIVLILRNQAFTQT